MSYVLDSSAMIALLRCEPGEDVVWQYLCDDVCYAHSINLCEVYYDFWRVGGEASATGSIEDLKSLNVVERNDFATQFWQEAGRVKAIHRRVSLADCIAITLTNRVGGSLITSDHHEMEAIAAAGVCSIIFFR